MENESDVVKHYSYSGWVVAEDGRAYSEEKAWSLCFNGPKSDYTLVTSAKETFMKNQFMQSVSFHNECAAVNHYKTTITTTVSLEQGQVESLLIKALGLEGKGVKAEWNQDGSVEVSYVSKE